jgi:hypothetical protein
MSNKGTSMHEPFCLLRHLHLNWKPKDLPLDGSMQLNAISVERLFYLKFPPGPKLGWQTHHVRTNERGVNWIKIEPSIDLHYCHWFEGTSHAPLVSFQSQSSNNCITQKNAPLLPQTPLTRTIRRLSSNEHLQFVIGIRQQQIQIGKKCLGATSIYKTWQKRQSKRVDHPHGRSVRYSTSRSDELQLFLRRSYKYHK